MALQTTTTLKDVCTSITLLRRVDPPNPDKIRLYLSVESRNFPAPSHSRRAGHAWTLGQQYSHKVPRNALHVHSLK